MIKDQIKWAVRRFPSITNPIWKLVCPRSRRDMYMERPPSDSRSDAFRDIFKKNSWDCTESRSGWGSTMAQTDPIRRKLPQLLKRLNVSTLLDAPCGDFHWMRHVDLGAVSYIGADIVPEIIANLNNRYASATRRFQVLDIVVGPVPPADVWLCRDVLLHLPTRNIIEVLSNFEQSSVKYILMSSYPLSTRNPDVNPGGFRTINLRLPPFNLPKPLLAIDDFVVAAPPKILGLWSKEQIRSWRANLSLAS